MPSADGTTTTDSPPEDATTDNATDEAATAAATDAPETSPGSPSPAGEAGPEPANRTAGSGPSSRGRRSTALLGAAVVLLAAGGAGLGVRWADQNHQEALRAQAVDAATRTATALTTLSHDRADQGVQALVDSSTGDFHDQMTRDQQAFIAFLQQGGVTSNGEVVAVAPDHVDDDGARVLVAASAHITSAQSPQQQSPADYRMAIELQHVGGRWLTSDVEFLP
ncbi:hypothetical protein [Pseudonocardia acidicola]|uniref:Mce-associated membrane protein n=1 Tax=Pseudonocardia acidicola TaxID=2724939 RepID=A0ABX1SD40_9PSEU|nr:hypothetical protein [Pseudonocardia acidicola]NMH98266.1 hypothetical protein [Pseudonocardia acidicola]